MPRIAGVIIPSEKRVEVALTAIYGIGPTRSKKILDQAKVNPDTRVKDLSEEQLDQLRALIDKEKVEGDLRREVTGNIKRLKELSCYRGSRHLKGLPTRGQRTKTNARTRRGRKQTVGSGRKASASKT